MYSFRRPPIPLSDTSLRLIAGAVDVPRYDRRALPSSVAHIGVGRFHRSHQALYFDDLAQTGASSEWGIAGITVRRPAIRDALAPQDHLYTLVERGARSESARVIGAIKECVFAPQAPERTLELLADPQLRLVTLTLTGGGYEPAQDAELPAMSAFDLLAAGLDRRRATGVAPFTVLSCDNLSDNGQAAREATVRAAARRDGSLADWVLCHVAFPNSVVDRITPETTPLTREHVSRRFGVADRAPVVAEPFSQWVIEDSFCNDRPPLDLVGARFVGDVADYALVKKRMLNGGHSALGYVGYLLGYRTTDEAMADPLVRRYIDRLLADEIAPLLPAPAGIDLDEYRRTLLDRFTNPNLGDQLSRLCGRGSTKMPAYLLPSIEDAVRRRGRHELLALAVAAWLRYLRGVDLEDQPIPIKDAQLPELQPVAIAAEDDPTFLLRNQAVFGRLRFAEPFVAALQISMRAIEAEGIRTTLEGALDGSIEAIVAR